MNKGIFITLEGGEGAGKSTQIKRLAAALSEAGREVVTTREPGGSPGAEKIRSLLLDASIALDDLTQTLLFAAARREHVVATIEPALARGAIVICDRFFDSTRAYQGAAGQVPTPIIDQLETIAVGSTRPDLTLILDLPPEIGIARAHSRRSDSPVDRYEGQALDFHRKVRTAFLEIARRDPMRCVVIDATGSADAVTAAIIGVVRERLSARAGHADA